MLRELISWVLNTYLGKYLEDFNPAQLSVALLSGEVELENVPIRKDALRSFGIPVQAVSGIIGKIKLQIPVRQFRTAPWCIVIENVYAVFSPKNPNDWDDELEKSSEFDYKLSELDSNEAIWRANKGYHNESFYYASSYTNWLNYGTALATNILENLELKIIDVHIRYEDSITIPNVCFASGIKIEYLTVQSCDSKWNLGSKTSYAEDIAFKLIELKNFSIYWDRMSVNSTSTNFQSKNLLQHMGSSFNSSNHHYILNPISARAQCKRERCKLPLRTRSKPRLSCTIIVSEVNITLSDFQYHQIIGCISGLENIKKIRSFRLIRPTCKIFGNASEWWRYAAQCHGYVFQSKAEKWQTFKDNLRYIQIYKRFLLNSNENITKEEKEFKTHIESVRTLLELNIIRDVCFNYVTTPDLNIQSQNINQVKGVLFHWFPNWWGWYGNSENVPNETQQNMADEEKYQNIEDDILNALEDSVGNNSYLKRDVVFGHFDFILSEGQFFLCSENKLTMDTSVIMEMNFQNLNLMIETRPRSGSHLIGLSLGYVCVKDHLTLDTEFPYLIKPQAKECNVVLQSPASLYSQSFTSTINNENMSDSNMYDPWFQLQYEKRPINFNTDFRLLIKSKSLDIVYNMQAFKWFIDFFSSPVVAINTKKRVNDRKKSVKPVFFKNWKNLLVNNLELRKTWSFEIDISAPQIIFVDNFTDKNSSIVLIDFGRFQLLKNGTETKSKEATDNVVHIQHEFRKEILSSEIELENDDDDMFLTPCSTPPGSENSPSDSPTICLTAADSSKIVINNDTGLESAFHNKIYDKYTIDLTDLQVLICKHRERNFASLKGSSAFHFLDKFSISLELERRIIDTLDPDYPSITLFGKLPKLVVHLNDYKINSVMGMLSLVFITNIEKSNKTSYEMEEHLKNSNEYIDMFQSNLVILQFVIDQMTLEVQSADRSIAELQVIGVQAGLSQKPEDTNISLSVHSLLLVDALQSFGPDFELLVASHRHVGMDSISGSLKQSEPCSPTSPASPDPMVYKRPTSPHVISNALNSLQTGNSNSWSHLDDIDALITVEINYIKGNEEEEPLQIANIHFNNLDIIANQETIAELLGFINRICNIKKQKREYSDEAHNIENEHDTNHRPRRQHLRTEVSFDFQRLNVLVLRALKKENFIVGRKVGTFTMSGAKIHATLGKETTVNGSLGGLQILDVTPEGIKHQRIFSVGKDPLTDPPDLIRQDLLSSLTQEMYGHTSTTTKEKNTDQKDALMFTITRNKSCVISIKIRMASVWYTHCARFIQEISWCAFQFKHYLKNFARSLRNKAADIAIEFVQQMHDQTEILNKSTVKNPSDENYKENKRSTKLGSRIKLDVILNSPVLVLPRSYQSAEVLVANLGKITINNSEVLDSPNFKSTFNNIESAENVEMLYSYFIDVRNINLFSLDTSHRKELRLSALPRSEEFYSCENDAVAILHDTAFQLSFSSCSEKRPNSTNEINNNEFLLVEGSVTQLLKVNLSRGQYEQLLESLDNSFKVPEMAAAYNTTSRDAREILNDGNESNAKYDHAKQYESTQIITRQTIKFTLPIFVITLNNEHNNPLIEITFREFSINYERQKNYLTNLQVLLRSILMEDLKCEIDSKYRHMVDSTPCNKNKENKTFHISSSCPDLVNLLSINNTSRSIPDNLQYSGDTHNKAKPGYTTDFNMCKYLSSENKCYTRLGSSTETKNVDNLVTYNAQILEPNETDSISSSRTIRSSIDFNCLNLIISVERWCMVLDFFGLLSDNVHESQDKDNPQQQHIENITKENSNLKISVRSLNLIFVRKEAELAKANVSHASFKIQKTCGTHIIEGRLGSISLIDLTCFGKLYREKFQTSGTEALNFHYKRTSQLKRQLKPSLDKDAVLQIQMSSVRYVHTKRFVMEIQSFVKEFLQLQTPVIRKITLSDYKTNINQPPTKIGLEIRAASPIVLLPICYESNELIVADLGELTLINNFQFASDDIAHIDEKYHNMIEILDVMQIDLVNINLFAGKRIKINEVLRKDTTHCFNLGSFSIVKYGNNIFQDTCYLKLQVERNINTNYRHNIPDVSVKGTLSKVSCILTLQQYKLIRGFLSYNMGEDIEDVYKYYSFNICESIGRINSILQLNQSTNESAAWNTLSIKMDLEDVSVHLHHFLATDIHEYKSLACINFIKSFLEIDSYSDGAQDIDLVSTEILITDTRYDHPHVSGALPNNVFTEILKPIRCGDSSSNVVQAEVHSRRRTDSTKYTILLNNMRIMAILDWMENVKDFMNEQIDPPSMKSHQQNVKLHSINSDNNMFTYEAILNITDSELVFVEKTNNHDTSAIILKSTTVVSYKPDDFKHPMSINLNHLEVFSCICGFENESALSIVDPVTLNIELRNNQLDVMFQKQLCIRLSYNDVKLFSKMLQSIPKQTRTAQTIKSTKQFTDVDFEIIAPLIAMGFNSKDSLYAMEINNYKLNEAAIWLSQQKQFELNTKSLEILSIAVCAQCISICVIDDCKDADVPLLEISLSRLSFLQKLREKNDDARSLAGNFEAIFASDYYNRRLSGWEPMIEPWECTGSWMYNTDLKTYCKNKFINLQISSRQLLKFNITSTLIELCKLVQNNWSQDYYEGIHNNGNHSLRRRTPFIPFVLKNDTGKNMRFKIILTQPGSITRTEIVQRDLVNDWIFVEPNQTVPFLFGPQNKLRHMDSHRLNVHQIIVAICGWSMVGPISIDKVGTFFRYSNADESLKRSRLVFEITLIGSAQKLITVRSAVRVFNKLNTNVLLNIGLKEYGKTYMIKPKDYFSIPLTDIESLIYIKPSFDNGIDDVPDTIGRKEILGFCKRGISWTNCGTDFVQELHSCPGQSDLPFNILTVIQRDKFPNRDVLHMPGHIITLVTPLIISNMLCCDILYKITGHVAGRIHASEKAYIYDINIHEAINVSFTLDNYTVFGQLRIPANHVGIVEPKLKLTDLNNRDLYLRASIQSVRGKGMEIYISAPIWLVNKTGLPLIYRQEGVNHIASGQFEEHERARNIAPLMFSFSDPDASPSLEIRLGMCYGENNPWCKSLNLHKDVIHRQLRADDSNGNYAIGIDVRRGRGRYSCTKVVTLSPRFQLYNRSTHELQFAQKCDIINRKSTVNILTAIPGCHFPFHWPNCEQEPLLCVRLKDVECCQWSSGIPINEVQSLYLNLRSDFGEMSFLRLEVILQGATYFLLFGDAHTLPPPIRIDNYSEVQINFSQHGYKPHWNTAVRPHSSLAYALDDSIGSQSLHIEAPGGNVIDFPLNKLEYSQSLTYSNFIYITFKETFVTQSTSENNSTSDIDIDNQHLVLGVKDKKVILMRKCTGDRSQLWLMNFSGQLEHEGSSPPTEPGRGILSIEPRMVLDLEKPPNPMDYTNLVIRPPNKQRETTQTWRFENGRLMCHANLCVQARNGVFGLYPGADAVLGRIESESRTLNNKLIPIEQSIERQKLRPGSGHLELISKMDGPILTIQIRDVKTKLDTESLMPDPLWKHTSTIVRKNNDSIQVMDEYLIKLDFAKGIGISLISGNPCEELAYLSLQNLSVEFNSTATTTSIDFTVSDIQIDNQLLDTSCPVLLYTTKASQDDGATNALIVNAKILPSLNENAVIIEYISINLKPYSVILEERLMLKIFLFLGLGIQNDAPANTEYENHYFERNILSTNSKRYYFENLYIGPCQIRLSVFTATKLPSQLNDVKKSFGLTLIKFEDVLIEFDKFTDRHHFETMDVYLTAIKMHYKNQIKWHAASILGSVDFLGNPLGFANDLSEGVSGLIFEGSVKSLVRNVTHGISNSTAKLTETLSDSLGRVVLDEQDNEARQKILEITSRSNTSAEHLAAGLKGLGFGLLGGVTSIVRHTYAGAQTDGLHGFISGFGKGLVGTVTKPIIGVLDLASETASAVRETSKGSHRILPERKRLPRCVTGAPGGLLPPYSYRQSKGQQYLYIINRRNLSEMLISYEPNLCNERDAKLRLLVSTEYVRIFSRCDEDPTIVLDCHLSEVLSCHPLTANIGTSIQSTPMYYIEISTNLPKITRPRIRCQNEEISERAARFINYAKSVYDEREQTVANE